MEENQKSKMNEMTAEELYLLGHDYEFGKTVEQDHHKAAELYMKAAELGSLKANKIFFFDFDRKQLVNTDRRRLNTIMEAAEMGYVPAEYSLGGRYRAGVGIRKSYSAAFYWLSKAAEQGHVEATYYLGAMYRRGRGTDINLQKAEALTLKAAELGSAPAQHEIGKNMLNHGGNVSEALAWMRLSSENGYRIAQFDLGMMVLEGRIEGCDTTYGVELLKSSANNRYAPAAYKIGEILENGLYGFAKDTKESVEWYKTAQEIGYVGAELKLTMMYQNGNGVERDLLQCIKYYKLADKHGWHYANNMLMDIFAN